MPDRIILATAKHFGVALVTKDRDMASAGIVPVVW
jgi:predicted nucleic acid-binding protein